MKITYYAAVSVAMVFSAPLGQGAPKTNDNAPATKAHAMIEEIDSLSVAMTNTADQLAMWAKSDQELGSRYDGLEAIKDDVNAIGRELRVLEAEQGALSGWESQTIDQIRPLMEEIASNTENAIQVFNSGRNHLWATSFPQITGKLFEDSQRVKDLLESHLQLASVRVEEQRLERQTGSTH